MNNNLKIGSFVTQYESGYWEVIDIKFSVSTSIFSEDQVYCFSAMIMYK